MEDTNLTMEEEHQLREALAEAPPDLKKGFCDCWPNVKKLLEWLEGRAKSKLIKWVVSIFVRIGDGIYKALGCDKATPESA